MSLVKIVNLPYVDKDFKIVQLRHGSEQVLLCGNTNDPANHRHYKILRDYLKENNIPFDPYVKDGRERRVMPALETENEYKVVGMGFMSVNIPEKTFEPPFSASNNYEIGPNKEFSESVTKAINKLLENPEKYSNNIVF